jgi:hypothetical protein
MPVAGFLGGRMSQAGNYSGGEIHIATRTNKAVSKLAVASLQHCELSLLQFN